MSGIFDAASDFLDELEKLIDKSTNAFVALLIMFFVTIPIVGVLSTMAFDTMSKSVEDNSAAQGAIDGAEAAYNVGGTIQDVYDIAKIVWPVVVAIGGLVGSAIVLITKFRDRLEDLFNR